MQHAGNTLTKLLPRCQTALIFSLCCALLPALKNQVGFSPDLAYALAACRYRAGDLSGAAAVLADVVQAGVQLHPELGIGTQTEGMEVGRVAGPTL